MKHGLYSYNKYKMNIKEYKCIFRCCTAPVKKYLYFKDFELEASNSSAHFQVWLQGGDRLALEPTKSQGFPGSGLFSRLEPGY